MQCSKVASNLVSCCQPQEHYTPTTDSFFFPFWVLVKLQIISRCVSFQATGTWIACCKERRLMTWPAPRTDCIPLLRDLNLKWWVLGMKQPVRDRSVDLNQIHLLDQEMLDQDIDRSSPRRIVKQLTISSCPIQAFRIPDAWAACVYRANT